jgi:hypothetical protein
MAVAAGMTCGETAPPTDAPRPSQAPTCAQQLWPVLTPLSFPDAATRSWRLLETCIECRSIRRLPSCRLLPVGSRSGTGETLRLPLYHEELAFTLPMLAWRINYQCRRRGHTRRRSYGTRCRPCRRRQPIARPRRNLVHSQLPKLPPPI